MENTKGSNSFGKMEEASKDKSDKKMWLNYVQFFGQALVYGKQRWK